MWIELGYVALGIAVGARIKRRRDMRRVEYILEREEDFERILKESGENNKKSSELLSNAIAERQKAQAVSRENHLVLTNIHAALERLHELDPMFLKTHPSGRQIREAMANISEIL